MYILGGRSAERPWWTLDITQFAFGSLLRFSGYMMMRAAMALGPAT